jgi:DMSO/TMAO reductase YedYZ molybdopterin-dependent catalytic subunit
MPCCGRVNDRVQVHPHAGWKTLRRTWRRTHRLIPGFVEPKTHILDPAQCSAADAEPRSLTRKCGDGISLWRDSVEAWRRLPSDLPEEAHGEAAARIGMVASADGCPWSRQMSTEKTPRLPPGQREIEELPVLHVGSVPTFDPAAWRLRADGEVREPRDLSYKEVRALAPVITTSDFHCVEGWSRLDCAWEGVRFSEICDLVSPTERARSVTISCDGGYTTSLPLKELLGPDVMLAWGMDGVPLTPGHGFPLRLVTPHKYAYKSAKWVRSIRFTHDHELGYWERRGYSDGADPWKEERRT